MGGLYGDSPKLWKVEEKKFFFYLYPWIFKNIFFLRLSCKLAKSLTSHWFNTRQNVSKLFLLQHNKLERLSWADTLAHLWYLDASAQAEHQSIPHSNGEFLASPSNMRLGKKCWQTVQLITPSCTLKIRHTAVYINEIWITLVQGLSPQKAFVSEYPSCLFLI